MSFGREERFVDGQKKIPKPKNAVKRLNDSQAFQSLNSTHPPAKHTAHQNQSPSAQYLSYLQFLETQIKHHGQIPNVESFYEQTTPKQKTRKKKRKQDINSASNTLILKDGILQKTVTDPHGMLPTLYTTAPTFSLR